MILQCFLLRILTNIPAKMRYTKSLIFCLLFFLQKAGVAADSLETGARLPAITDTVYLSVDQLQDATFSRPSPLLHKFREKQKKNKKIVAVLLAFPFPFGIVGLHRIYLGCAPYVPVAYIGSLGGVFGILPFIDFCVLLLDKDIDRYIENKKIFMWIN